MRMMTTVTTVNDDIPFHLDFVGGAVSATRGAAVCRKGNHSHSVVPGGLDVRSNSTREIPGILDSSSTIVCSTFVGNLSVPGIAGTPVMKSFVTNGRRTTDRMQDGVFCAGSRSKCTGIRITGIWEILRIHSCSIKILFAMLSAWRSCHTTASVSNVCVISCTGYCTTSPKM